MSNQGCVCFPTNADISLDAALTTARAVAGGETQRGCRALGSTGGGPGEGVAAPGQMYSTSLIPAISLVCPRKHHLNGFLGAGVGINLWLFGLVEW